MTSRLFAISAPWTLVCIAPASAAIMGPRAGAILTSGTPTQDRNEQTEFARLARAKHEIQVSPMNPNRAILSIGDEDWPFPVPTASGASTRRKLGWRCARGGSAPAKLDAIEICHGYAEAQTKYLPRIATTTACSNTPPA